MTGKLRKTTQGHKLCVTGLIKLQVEGIEQIKEDQDDYVMYSLVYMCLNMKQKWNEWADVVCSSVHLLLFAGHIRTDDHRCRM